MPFRISCSRLYKLMLASILVAAVATSQAAWAQNVRLQRWPAATPAPTLQLNDLEGNAWALPSLRGKVVVLNFWATWCAPCVDELPILNELAASEAHKGRLVVLGINFKESDSTIQRFASEHRFQYPILADKSGASFKAWTNGILPTTVLIDRQGRPRWRLTGELDRHDPALRRAIEQLLQEPGGRNAGRSVSKAQ